MHGRQLVARYDGWWVPAGHSWHVLLPALLLKWPGMQSMHLPSEPDWPGAHGTVSKKVTFCVTFTRYTLTLGATTSVKEMLPIAARSQFTVSRSDHCCRSRAASCDGRV